MAVIDYVCEITPGVHVWRGITLDGEYFDAAYSENGKEWYKVRSYDANGKTTSEHPEKKRRSGLLYQTETDTTNSTLLQVRYNDETGWYVYILTPDQHVLGKHEISGREAQEIGKLLSE